MIKFFGIAILVSVCVWMLAYISGFIVGVFTPQFS